MLTQAKAMVPPGTSGPEGSAGSLSADFSRAADPAQLMRDAGFEPDAWQEAMLRSQEPCQLLLCARQTGKSTATSALALWTAVYAAPALVLMISPSLRQSSELFRKALDFINRLEGIPPIANDSTLRVEFKNGSRIIALPGSEGTVRGYSAADLVIVDEAARVPDDLYAAIRPMLATSQGKMIALTTPWGCRGWFYEAWTSPDQGWRRTKITAEECPRIDPEWLEDERNLVGQFAFQQEYECRFVDTEDQIFPSALIEAAFTSEIEPLWPV